MLLFVAGGKPKNPKKNPRRRKPTTNTYDWEADGLITPPSLPPPPPLPEAPLVTYALMNVKIFLLYKIHSEGLPYNIVCGYQLNTMQ